MVERALLIGFYFQNDEQQEAAAMLRELDELVSGLGIGIVGCELIRVRDSNKQFICGSGKAEEINIMARGLEADCIIIDNMLAPMQQRSWERLVNLAVIDREEIILDIFAKRARTREAQLQVELARMQYSLPRLARMWSHLDRQGGGSGGGGAGAARGEGEKQIEVDRRLARQRIEYAQRELAEMRKQRATRRKERERQAIPQAAIVGYTNAGKSTLLNALTGAEVLAKDMLFATLDTTTRKIELEDGQALLLTDTVGFIRNLPHRLVESFKATLEEAVLADFLIHVLDASSEEAMQLYTTTLQVLEELGASDKPSIVVLNKIDLINTPEQLARLADLQKNIPGTIKVSVLENIGLQELLLKCTAMLHDRVQRAHLRIPQSQGHLLALLHRDGKVLSVDYEDNDILVSCIISTKLAAQLGKYHQA